MNLCSLCKKHFATCNSKPMFGIDEDAKLRGVEADAVIKCTSYEDRRFRFYITDTMNGVVLGTNDESFAKETAECEDYFVIDTATGTWILSDRSHSPIYDAQDPERP